MQSQPPEPQSFDMNEMSLREHLLAAQAQAQAQAHQPTTPDHIRPSSPGSHHQHNIDPAIAGPAYALSPGESGGEGSPDGKRGSKRELSTSKRAAQNRAAQRAFRQRKEGYIKKLEEQVRDFHALEENYKQVQAENYQLRDYVINLQSRLIESQQDYPQPPPAIDLQNPRDQHANISGQLPAPTAQMGQSAVSQLQAAAAAAQAGEFDDLKHSRDENIIFADDGIFQSTKRSRTDDLPGLAQAASLNEELQPQDGHDGNSPL